jgi:murein L,D-transpeptidase YcbB/YkuD
MVVAVGPQLPDRCNVDRVIGGPPPYRPAPRPRKGFFTAGAMALAAIALSPLAAAAADSVPIGAVAPLSPEAVMPGPAALPSAPQAPSPPSATAVIPPPPTAAAEASAPIGAAAPLPQMPGDPQLQALLYGSDAPMVAGERLRHPGLVRQFYAEHGNEPFWDSHGAQASALLGAVFRAQDQGLDPALFHAAVLSGRGVPLSPVERDVLTSDAVLSYADALAEGAVPRGARPATEALDPMPIDVVAAVDQAIAAPDPTRIIAALAPSSPEYAAMRQAYAYYRYYGGLAVGAPDAQGDTPDAANDDAYANGSSTPDDGNGADDDSRYGAAPAPVDPWLAARRARQLAVGLERLRWLPRPLPPDRIVVNTAIQQLHYFQGNQTVFTTRVVVGEPTWQTPEFHATIDDVLFNPPWRVPLDIMRKEILPKLARYPGYLAAHHMRWIGPMQIEQVAGPHSALGRLKFEMADPYDVYLHDTPEKHLFRLANRMKSHGCVRVEDPQELAALLLDESPAEIWRGIAEGRTHAQALPEPIDVYIIYQTVSVEPSGAIVFHADPYHRDARIWQLLNPTGELPMAQDDGLYARKG